MIFGDIEHVMEEVERYTQDRNGVPVCEGTYGKLNLVVEYDQRGHEIANIHVMAIGADHKDVVARTLGRGDVEFRLIVAHLAPDDRARIAARVADALSEQMISSSAYRHPVVSQTSAGRSM